jgi:hypothetical protein
MRPPETSCIVAYQLAATVGSRMPGLVTQWPSFSRVVAAAASGGRAKDSCHKTWEIVGPAVIEPMGFGAAHQVDQPRIWRIGQDSHAKAQHATPLPKGREIEHIAASTRKEG